MNRDVGLSLRFEFVRTIRKPAFWTGTLLLPVFVVLIGLIMTAASGGGAAGSDRVPFTYSDESGQVVARVAADLGGRAAVTTTERRDAREHADRRAYIAVPRDPAREPVQVFAPDRGWAGNTAYPSLVERILRESALAQVPNAEVRSALTADVSVTPHTTVHGEPSRDLGQIVPPLLFAAALFIVVLVSGNRMLVSTIEEKENRVIEMLLVGMRPMPFVVGKILALFALTALQLLVIFIPVLTAFGLLQDRLPPHLLGAFRIEVLPAPVALGALLLAGGLALFTGLLVGIGALTNSAKDAGPYLGALLIAMVLPVYAIATLLTDPDAPIVRAMIFFPITSPITALVLNAMGTLQPADAAVAVAELVICGTLAVLGATRLFASRAIPGGSRRSGAVLGRPSDRLAGTDQERRPGPGTSHP